jgi:hypothetical protein
MKIVYALIAFAVVCFAVAATPGGGNGNLERRVSALEHAVRVIQANNEVRDQELAQAEDQLACYHGLRAKTALVRNRHGRLIQVVRLTPAWRFKIVASAC